MIFTHSLFKLKTSEIVNSASFVLIKKENTHQHEDHLLLLKEAVDPIDIL